MKILNVHKNYFYRDGASTYFLELEKLLKTYGNEVVPFSMKHPENLKTKFEKYFIDEIDFRKKDGFTKKVKKVGHFLYSKNAQQKLEKLILDHGPFDVAHLHNIYHHLSPAILHTLKKHKIPVVMSLHDYKLVSSDYTLVSRRSFSEKALGGLEKMLHKVLKSYDKVDKFIAPSNFIKDFCVKAGWPKSKFQHLPYMLDSDNWKYESGDEGYIAYAGRLSHEKGLMTLMKAAAHLHNINLKIAGTGPVESHLKQYVRHRSLNHIEFVGFLSKPKLRKFLANAAVVVVPSEWFENFPFSVVEAMSMGKIVVASRIGGIPEQINQNKTGFLFTPKDAHALADTLQHVYNIPSQQRDEIGLAAREWVVQNLNLKKHYKGVMQIYESVSLNKN